MNFHKLWILPVFITAVLIFANAAHAQDSNCDRRCLLQFLTDYTEAQKQIRFEKKTAMSIAAFMDFVLASNIAERSFIPI